MVHMTKTLAVLGRHGITVNCIHPGTTRTPSLLTLPIMIKRRFSRMSLSGVRRDKAALSSGCKPHPAIRSSRKQSEQSWR